MTLAINSNKNLFAKMRQTLNRNDKTIRGIYFNNKTEKTAYLSLGEEMLYTYLGLI